MSLATGSSAQDSVNLRISRALVGSTDWSPTYRPRLRAKAVISGSSICLMGGFVQSFSTNSVRDFGCFDPVTLQYGWREPFYSAAGDFGLATLGNHIHMVGGISKGMPSEGNSYFSPEAGRWTINTSLPFPLIGLGLASIGDIMYAVGGQNVSGRPLSNVFAFSQGKGWSVVRPMRDARAHPLVVSAYVDPFEKRQMLFALMGSNGTKELATVEAFDPVTGTWTPRADIPMARPGAVVVSIRSKIFVIGGAGASGCETTVQIYDTQKDQWGFGPLLPEPRCDAAAAAIGGKIFVFGGIGADSVLHGNRATDSIAVLDLLRERWVLYAQTPSEIATSDIDTPANKRVARAHDIALIVGVENYKSVPQAKFAEHDVKAVAVHLEALGVPHDNIVSLVGPSATMSGISKFIEAWLPKNVAEDSHVYFYFSGHGTRDPITGNAYLVPWDGDLNFLEQSAYPLQRIYDKLSALPAKKIVVLLDSCFSGTGDRSVASSGLRPLVNAVETRAPPKLTVLTASSSNETAGSLDSQGHGLFTYYLLKSLMSAEVASSTMTYRQLHSDVQQSVVNEAHRQNREQHPQLSSAAPDEKID